jgi:alcohol dehydrogenase class IV
MSGAHTFLLPPVVVYGAGASERAGAEARRLAPKGGRVLVVTDRGVVQAGYAGRVTASLEAEGFKVSLFDGVQPDPTVQNVADALALYRREAADLIVGLGGGSSIDCAKGAAVLATNPGPITAYAGLDKVPGPAAPLIAIPTTAGTGSEVTKYTVITDTGRNVKLLIGSPHITPRVALVDPRLTYTMPRGLTAAVGIDTLTHAIEAYVSVRAQPMTDLLALNAIRLVAGNLRQAWANPDGVAARDQMMLASLQAGMAFTNASVALVHGMSRPIGAHFHVPHGLSNAVLLGPVMDFSVVGNPPRYADIAAAMGEPTAGCSVIEAARRATVAVRRLIEDVQVPALRGLGITEEQLEAVAAQMAEDALASGSPANNPRKPTRDEIIALYRQAL